MLTLHPNILERDGKKAFVVLPYEEFQNLQEELDEYEDLKDLREAKVEESNANVESLSSVRSALNI
jgi:PHD/YefM family antitoxin component YafN of YafNO toxin-antitoxin module